MKIKKYIIFLSVIILFFTSVCTAYAAKLFLLPQSSTLQIGKTLDVEVRIDSEGAGFNASQATIEFPKNILQVESVSFTGGDSVFNFWLQEPTYSNENGTISFVGGSSKGIIGASLKILGVKFMTKNTGTAPIRISDAAVTASDGSGTNILSKIETSTFTVEPITTVSQTKEIVSVPPPVQIKREPAPATNLPAQPTVTVSLYPDQKSWYNLTSDFLVQWILPKDITGVATAINKNPSYIPSSVSEGLFDAKTIPAQKDGIWYFHIKFQNSFGWGSTAHYKISIDTVPPLPFEVDVSSGNPSDTPTPTIKFASNDALSGLKNYAIKIGSNDFISCNENILTLPVQSPGTTTVLVRAVDNAGNMTEDTVDLFVNPIESPVITHVTTQVFVGESTLGVSGTVLNKYEISISLKNLEGEEILRKEGIEADEDGLWSVNFSEAIKIGKYYVEAIAKDTRGATSFPAKSDMISIQEKPIFTLGGVSVGKTGFFSWLLTLLAVAFVAGWILNIKKIRQEGRKIIVAQRDIVNVFSNIHKDLEKVLKNYEDNNVNEREEEETKFLLNKIKVDLEKTEKFIVENIGEISG